MMRFTIVGLLATGLLYSCGVREPIDSDAIAPPHTTAELSADSPSLQETTFEPIPGRYCYLLNNSILAVYLRLTLDDNYQVQGDARSLSQIENQNDTDNSPTAQAFLGSLTENKSTVELTTWGDADVQSSRETWTLTNETLQTKDHVLNLTDCQLVDPAFQDHNGLEAKDLLEGANNVNTQRVEFAPDRTYAVASNSVIRGDRDVYLLRAGKGQRMSLTIQALEDNAVFDVISPSGYILAFSAVNETIRLPHTGDY